MLRCEDLEAWQHGLLFLMGDQNGDESPSTKAPETKLKDKEELRERLQQENNMLKEMIKRKDATIAAPCPHKKGAYSMCDVLSWGGLSGPG